MSLRIKISIACLSLALLGTLIFSWISDDPDLFGRGQAGHFPDYYMEHFSTLTMEQDGRPKNRLIAEYMAHYPDDDTIELINPRLEIYKEAKPPMIITSDKGWVTSNNKVILLTGDVDLWQDDDAGLRELEVITSDVRVLLDQDYAETDSHATIKKQNSVVDADGVRAYFKQNRLELLNNVQGKLHPKKPG